MINPTVSRLFASSNSLIHHDHGSTPAKEIGRDGGRLASSLRELGLVPGDRIAVWATNGLPYLQCLAAAAAGRFVLVSVNTRFSSDEAWSITTRAGARLLITDQSLDRDPGTVRVVTASALQALIEQQSDTDSHTTDSHTTDSHTTDSPAEPDDPFVVFTTSGTTSQPKLVLHTQRSIATHANDIPGRFTYDEKSRVMVALPLCGVFGLDGLVGALAAGSTIWLPSGFDAEAIATTIENEQITAMNGSDDMFHRLLQTDHDLSSVTVAGYGRFNTSLDGIVERAHQRGLRLSGIYGMSEVQALYAFRDPTEPPELRQRAGGATASPLAAARVVDPETNDVLPIGVDGELQLRGPSLFTGYLAEGGDTIDVELTGAAHVDDGAGQRWFRSGDLGRMEPDGTFTYITRIGDVLRLGGFLVSPSEIEEVLMEIDGVDAAQVVAVARPGGVRPVAFVINTGPIVQERVIAHCAERLAKFKVPIRVFEVDAFPTTPSANGTKIQRNRLRDFAVEALA